MLPAIWHRYIFLFGIIGLAAGMLFGTVPTSIPQIILAANWLLEFDFQRKWQVTKTNKIFWLLLSFFILHMLGMIYTQNYLKGLDDLRNKIPLIVLPLIFFTTYPLNEKEFKYLFKLYFLGVFVSSIYCYLVYAGYTKKNIVDVRNASVFMSHIRYSLFISFAIIGLCYYSVKESKFYNKLLYILIAAWLAFFMYKLDMATGALFLILTTFLLLIFNSFKWLNKTIALSVLGVFLIVASLIISKAYKSLNMYEQTTTNPANIILHKTQSGNTYFHNTQSTVAENGNLINININEDELKKEWNKRSKNNFDSLDNKGNKIRFTLLRYLASKGMAKDSVAVSKLSPEDIDHIENGISNYKYDLHSGLISKWRELVWEYTKFKKGENPSGHSISMRLEFWKTGVYIFNEHPLFGVGTGDIQDSYNHMYEKTNSKLETVWRLRCHNQYLAITVAFGLFGLTVFLFYLLYPAYTLRKTLHFLYWPFFSIAVLSFFTEDTLETQSGVTFFIFFQTLFLWLASAKSTPVFENKKEL